MLATLKQHLRLKHADEDHEPAIKKMSKEQAAQ